jgi:1-acyl-sn-glycerol-3-phosphate acyltransferase
MNKIISIIFKIFLAPIVFILLIKEIKGKLPKTNFILAPNHQSYIDIIVCGYLCVPRKFTFIGQIDKGKGIIGFLRDSVYFITGVIPLNRKDENSKMQAYEKAVEALKKGYCLVIYPEGKRSQTGEVQEGKWGVAKLFLETKVPIVPLGITGAFEVMPPKEKLNIKRIIKLNIGKPIFYEEKFKSNDYESDCIDITNKVMEEIKKLVYED